MNNTLREMRRTAGYATQELFASAIGCTRDAVAQWEIGAAFPRAPTLPKLAAVLGVTESDIIVAIAAARQNSA